MLKEPVLSPNFTIDDIHKLREYNYERRKNMTFDEYKADVANGANRALAEIERLKREKQSISVIHSEV